MVKNTTRKTTNKVADFLMILPPVEVAYFKCGNGNLLLKYKNGDRQYTRFVPFISPENFEGFFPVEPMRKALENKKSKTIALNFDPKTKILKSEFFQVEQIDRKIEWFKLGEKFKSFRVQKEGVWDYLKILWDLARKNDVESLSPEYAIASETLFLSREGVKALFCNKGVSSCVEATFSNKALMETIGEDKIYLRNPNDDTFFKEGDVIISYDDQFIEFRNSEEKEKIIIRVPECKQFVNITKFNSDPGNRCTIQEGALQRIILTEGVQTSDKILLEWDGEKKELSVRPIFSDELGVPTILEGSGTDKNLKVKVPAAVALPIFDCLRQNTTLDLFFPENDQLLYIDCPDNCLRAWIKQDKPKGEPQSEPQPESSEQPNDDDSDDPIFGAILAKAEEALALAEKVISQLTD